MPKHQDEAYWCCQQREELEETIEVLEEELEEWKEKHERSQLEIRLVEKREWERSHNLRELQRERETYQRRLSENASAANKASRKASELEKTLKNKDSEFMDCLFQKFEVEKNCRALLAEKRRLVEEQVAASAVLEKWRTEAQANHDASEVLRTENDRVCKEKILLAERLRELEMKERESDEWKQQSAVDIADREELLAQCRAKLEEERACNLILRNRVAALEMFETRPIQSMVARWLRGLRVWVANLRTSLVVTRPPSLPHKPGPYKTQLWAARFRATWGWVAMPPSLARNNSVLYEFVCGRFWPR